VPAHYCGVFGHKPSWGLCSGRGQSLIPIAGMTDIAVIGPLARSARDLSLALDTIAGADPVQDVGYITLPAPRALRLSDLRIAVWSSEPGQETDTETCAYWRPRSALASPTSSWRKCATPSPGGLQTT
jgi:amidase